MKGKVEEAQEKQKQYDDGHAKTRDLTVGQRVIPRNFQAGSK